MKKVLAVMRDDDGLRGCPFGLCIPICCENVGDAIDQMKPLQDIADDQKDRIAAVNRKIYRHHQEGKPCKYLEGVIKNREIVNCDFGDFGAGEHDTPLRSSPYYPRVFLGGLGQAGLWSFQLGDYSNNPDASSSASPGHRTSYDVAVHAEDLAKEYLKTGHLEIKTIENPSPSTEFYEFENSFLTSSTN